MTGMPLPQCRITVERAYDGYGEPSMREPAVLHEAGADDLDPAFDLRDALSAIDASQSGMRRSWRDVASVASRASAGAAQRQLRRPRLTIAIASRAGAHLLRITLLRRRCERPGADAQRQAERTTAKPD